MIKTGVFIITGFLGTGKTTLVRHILNSSPDLSKTAVLVNEFGKTGIDGELIRQTAAADVVELASGCICCSLKTDMIQALRRLKDAYAPDRVLIEATGVADPLSIIEVLREQPLAEAFLLGKTVTVLDSDFWESREGFGTVFASQLIHADLILLNKIDTVDRSKIPGILAEIRQASPDARIIPCVHCHIDPDLLWQPQGPERSEPGGQSPFQLYDPGRDAWPALNSVPAARAESAGFTTFCFETGRIMDEPVFKAFLASVPLQLFRIKGPVKFADRTEMLNFAGGRAQWREWDKTGHTRLTFIGWDVAEKPVLEKLESCLQE